MGVVNVTPDSFSDGGRYLDAEKAVAHGVALSRAGADLVDVGGESTRPGAQRPSAQEEQDRVLPVVQGLAGAGVKVSIDTMRADVARASVGAGAVLVNDVSGGRADPAMFSTVAELGAAYVLMHWRDHAATMQQHTGYADVLADVAEELAEQLDAATSAGISESRIAVDPGIGFSKTPDQNWAVLTHLDRLHDLGHPLLVATSRKRFLGLLVGEDRPAVDRDPATAATSVLAAVAGAWCVRVHDVSPTYDAVRVAARWVAGAETTAPAGPAHG
jgi:dihydropteroate synthase